MREREAGGLSGGERCEQGRWQGAAWQGPFWIRTIDNKRKKELKLQQTFAPTWKSTVKKNKTIALIQKSQSWAGRIFYAAYIHTTCFGKLLCIWKHSLAWPQMLEETLALWVLMCLFFKSFLKKILWSLIKMTCTYFLETLLRDTGILRRHVNLLK